MAGSEGHQFCEGTLDTYLGWIRSPSTTLASPARRTRSANHDLVLVLPEQPVLNSGVVATALGVSERTARTALHTLDERGILRPIEVPTTAGGRPKSWWCAPELLDVVGAWAD